jgi:hypothetical protein
VTFEGDPDFQSFADELEKIGSMKGFSRALKRRSPAQLRTMWEGIDKRVRSLPLLHPKRSSKWVHKTDAAGELIHRELLKRKEMGFGLRPGH